MGNHKVLRTPDANLWRYSMYDLIEAIRNSALLWDREHADFHNRELRQEAWHEVARHVYKCFDDVIAKEKDTIIKTLQKRWKNTRDSYLRNWRLKQTISDNVRGAYIYDKELAFLLKCKEEPSTAQSANEADNEQTLMASKARVKKTHGKRKQQTKRKAAGSNAQETDKKRLKKERHNSSSQSEQSELVPTDQPAKAATQLDDDSSWETECTTFDVVHEPAMRKQQQALFEETILAASTPIGSHLPLSPEQLKGDSSKAATPACDSAKQSAAVPSTEFDADQAFFDSIKPYLLKMTTDQKLDFQIDVLKLLKNYRH